MTKFKRKEQYLIFAAAFLIVFCAIKLASADQELIEINGHAESADCHYEYTDPVTKICKSESWLCKIQGGLISCEVTR
jgi:hypothetical protein